MVPVRYMLLVSGMLMAYVSADDMCIPECKCSDDEDGNFHINCDKLQSVEIPRDLSKFAGFDKPIRLSLSENAFKRVSKGDFPPNVQIVALDLSRNRGLTITDDAFANIKNLRSLNLDDLRLPFTSNLNFLKGLSKLQSLSLNKNYQFGDGLIPASMISGLGLNSLNDLQFQECYIKGIEDGAFSGININGHLDLSANQLDHIPDELKTLNNVTSLDISQNSLRKLPSNSFLGMGELRKLSISNNYISEKDILVDSFNGLQLQELSLEQSVLNTIPTPALKGLSKLKVLRLKNNPIKTIPEGAFNGSYCLEELDISNALVEIGMVHLEDQMDCIQKLYLNNMQIREVPAFIKNFKILDFLLLDGNSITTIKKGDFVDTTVSKVSLAMNPLTEIQAGAFAEFPQTVTLVLSKTQITNLNFVRDYPYGTIREIELKEITPICDCDLAFAEYRTYVIHGNCNLNGTREVVISSEDFMKVTSDCWPGGRSPMKKDVWAVKGNNSANSVESSNVMKSILFCLALILGGRV
ncbi:hypothetical protein SNE40_018902 [Patella caerulea]|uniref:Uncharacterized protein n=1 Tax=Patella caerulea TaxID=87958 RepID=A0AAN8J848_PATCE